MHAIGRQQNPCDNNNALVQSGLQVRFREARRRSLAVPEDRTNVKASDETLFTKIADSTRKTWFSSLSALKIPLSQRNT
jgi:hypothetical protein